MADSARQMNEELAALRAEVNRLRSVEADLATAEKLREVMAEISTVVSFANSLEGLIENIHGLLGQLIDTRNFFVALHDADTGTYSIPFYRDEYDELDAFVEVGALEGSLTDYVRRTGKCLFLTPEIEERLQTAGEIEGVKGTPARYWLGAPLHVPTGETIGVVVVQSYDEDQRYSRRHLKLMEAVAGQIAVSVERKRFEEALSRSHSFLETVIERAPFGIVICEGDHEQSRITVMNREAQRVFGVDRVFLAELNSEKQNLDCSAMPWQMLSSEGVPWPDEEIPIKVAMALGTLTPSAEMVIRRSSGTECTVLVNAAPIRDRDNRLIGGVSTYTDISNRKKSEEERLRLERQLLQSQKLESLGVLAGGIAHDFNNLLMVILANSDVLLLESEVNSATYEAVLEIEDAAQQASDLVRELSSYSGQTRYVTEAVSINTAISKVQNMLRMAVSRYTTLEYDLCEDLPLIDADSSQIQQVIMGLVANASEAVGDKGGIVTVRTGEFDLDRESLAAFIHGQDLEEGRYVYLEVEDTGCGMDEETKARIFDPFYSTKFVGRGLGLAAVQGIVNVHRGGIRLDSEPGRGSVFTVILPIRENSGAHAILDEEEVMQSAAENRPDGEPKGHPENTG